MQYCLSGKTSKNDNLVVRLIINFNQKPNSDQCPKTCTFSLRIVTSYQADITLVVCSVSAPLVISEKKLNNKLLS